MDVSSPAVEFQLASVLGRQMGAEQCETVYGQCPLSFEEVARRLRKTAAENNLI